MPDTVPDIRLIEQVAQRIFSHAASLSVERVAEGVSTFVYRVRRGEEVFYLRVLPEGEGGFAPEVYVHQRLRAMGVSIPDVVQYEYLNEVLRRSIVVMTEIQGERVDRCTDEADWRAVLREAGRDLALINSLPVESFGWIRRDRAVVTRLEAEYPTYRAFVNTHLEGDLAALENERIFDRSMIRSIRLILARYDSFLEGEQAWLAHGDFDVTHIYQEQGRYTGIIDFGEIRGANALYDLGHFRLHDGETLPARVFPYLLAGYAEITALPADCEQRIAFSSLLIGIRTLAHFARKYPQHVREHYAVRAVPEDIEFLL